MAAEKGNGRDPGQFFLDEDGDDESIDVNNIGGGGSGTSSDFEKGEVSHHQGSASDAFASQQWPQSYRWGFFIFYS
jgi:hypothetical protein